MVDLITSKMDENEDISNRKRKRSKIMLVARDIFSKYGYKKTNMVDIANAMGINQANLYYYFDNQKQIKDQIFLDCFTNEMREFRTQIIHIMDENTAIQEKLTNFYVFKLDYTLSSEIIKQFYQTFDFKRIPKVKRKEISELLDMERSFIKKVLIEATKKGEVKSMEDEEIGKISQILINQYLGIRYQNQVNYFLSDIKPDLDEMKGQLRTAIEYIFQNIMV
ncbi:MAG: TetR/AcrR family transcriptional regulator [Promethearchaeota archaeon]|nr:MAG: TetR/AcrR family transcriptional regulator [Candidatus Lokiarchaeota archaeon]